MNSNGNQINVEPFTVLKKTVFYAFLISLVCGHSGTARAANIFDIAKDFVNRIGNTYVEKVRITPIEQIPDGGTLLLKPRSQKLLYTDDIYAIKHNDAIYLAFDDVINILDFPIDYDKDNGTAKGWFIREDWEFDADFNDRRVIAKNTSFLVKPEHLHDDDGLLFIQGDALAKWLGLNFDYDIKDQVINIESPFPLPSIARNLRHAKGKRNDTIRANEAKLPRLPHEKKNFDINTGNVFIGTNYNKPANSDATISNDANITLEGELLKHNAYFLASGDDDDGVQNIVARLIKRSESPTLLGALKARSYAVGDIDLTEIPLTGSTGQDLGFRFDNQKLDNTDFASTDIEGDSIPDYDIELYRNDILINSQTVDSNGRYRFEDIQLFSGDNDFELFFFGPQGEVRTERLSVPVTQELLSSQDNTYEVSVSFEDTQTLQEQTVGDEDRNAPHLAARYNKLIGKNNLGFLGFRTNQIEGERKLFLTSGLSSTLGQTLLDTNFAVDESGEVAAEAILRRRLAGWDVSLNARANTDGYVTSDTSDPEVMSLGFNAQKSINPFGLRTNLLANGSYLETALGSELSAYGIGISNSIYGANVSNRFFYEKNDIIDGESTERYDHSLSVRKALGKYFLRLGSTYEISPDARFRNIVGQINYRHDNSLSMDLNYDKQLVNELDTTRFNLNYTHDKFRLSPFIQYRSDDEVIGGLNLNFSLSDNPQSPFPDFDSRRYVGGGALSALVYHDKDGNFIFDGDDEPLEDAIIESVNYSRRAPTNSDGYASIKDLSINKATDIILDPESLPDPFMIPATKGNSVLADPGSLYQTEFPVHLTGEVEGTVSIINGDGEKSPASFQTLELHPLDSSEKEVITVRTERDGYYVVFNIPPGKYLIQTANKNDRYGNDIPKYVTIGYDGTIIKDINFNISKELPYVPYKITHDDLLKESVAVLEIGNAGQSSLAQTLSRLIQVQNDYNPYEGLTKIDGLGGDYYTMTSKDIEAFHDKCQEILSNNLSCRVLIH